MNDRLRLDSWKDIATYLRRDVRTVIRWEQERGLPVHRVPGGRNSRVFAYPDELDAWLAIGRATNGDSDEVAEDTTDEGVIEPTRITPWRRRSMVAAAALAAAAAIAVAIVMSRGRSEVPAQFRVAGNE